jgi:hypothetical protein
MSASASATKPNRHGPLMGDDIHICWLGGCLLRTYVPCGGRDRLSTPACTCSAIDWTATARSLRTAQMLVGEASSPGDALKFRMAEKGLRYTRPPILQLHGSHKAPPGSRRESPCLVRRYDHRRLDLEVYAESAAIFCGAKPAIWP